MTGWLEQAYGTRQAAYDLKKIRGKDRVAKVTGTRRYLPALDKLQSVCALLLLREKVLKPVLAGAGKPKRGPNPKHPKSIIDVHYEILQKDLRSTFTVLDIAV